MHQARAAREPFARKLLEAQGPAYHPHKPGGAGVGRVGKFAGAPAKTLSLHRKHILIKE